MSGWLIAFVGLIYCGVAVDQYRKGDYGLAIAYAGYAFSNIGLYMVTIK